MDRSGSVKRHAAGRAGARHDDRRCWALNLRGMEQDERGGGLPNWSIASAGAAERRRTSNESLVISESCCREASERLESI